MPQGPRPALWGGSYAEKGGLHSLDRVVRPPRSGRRLLRGRGASLSRCLAASCSCSWACRSWCWSACLRGASSAPRRCPTCSQRPSHHCFPISRCHPSRTSPASGSRATDDYVQFTAAVSNVGVGAFIVHAVRGDGRGSWRVSQRFDEPDGSTSESVTKGDVVWGGHGHDHWHVHLGRVLLAHATGLERGPPELRQGRVLLLRPAAARHPTVDRAGTPAVSEERLQRARHARVHDGSLARMGRPLSVGSPRPAAPPDGPRTMASTGSGPRPTRAGGSARRTRRTTRRGSISASSSTGRRPPSRSSAAARPARPPGSRGVKRRPRPDTAASAPAVPEST